jgi:D-alanyl-lipoteichoic acid acyltransferase DltB (MBOAT superfamily)
MLSLAGIGLVFGLQNGAWLVGIGLLLIGICHLPVSFAIRIAVLLLAGGGLALSRVQWFDVPWSSAVWPILGSMFMFRLIVYLYDLRYNNAPVSFTRSLSYFFLLPNVCFPLFPVVDYQKFHHNYYDEERHRIYQTGVDWMVRGVIHLILYRIIYQYMTIGPSEVESVGDLTRYMLTTFLLYLRVSGQFHLIIGMLHLFGFNLPETNRYYLLASSFTDFWRRINIYWKDFMMKVFYYPIYFKLRKYGNAGAVVFTTFIVFIITWFLHSYQWFWLRGTFPVIWQDAVYWTALAVLVAINSLYEMKYGRKRNLSGASWAMQDIVVKTIRILVTLSVVCILWSLWSSDTINSWLSLWAPLGNWTTADSRMMSFMVVAGMAVGGLSGRKNNPLKNRKKRWQTLQKAKLVTVLCLPLLALLGVPAVYTKFNPETATFIHTLRKPGLSKQDVAKLERGYYEDLNRVNRFNTPLWEVYMNKPVDWLDVKGSGLGRFTGDFLQKDLIPSYRASTSFSTISTNRWGMRDQDYEQQPAPGSYRIGLLGASMSMGWGVEDNETYEAILEERLNHELAGKQYRKFEILNFSVAGYYPLQQAMVVEKAISFSPDAIFYIATGREFSRTVFYLAEVIRKKVDVPYDELLEIAHKAGIKPGMEESEAIRRLAPFREQVLLWLYRHIVQICREQGIVPVWIFLPQLTEGAWQKETDPARQLAKDSGFIVLDFNDMYKGMDTTELYLAEWDKHPNVKGHQLIAERLYEAIRENEGALFTR